MCHVSGPRGNSLGYFCPSRTSFQCFSQASGASRSQHRLSSFLLTKDGSRGCNAVGSHIDNCDTEYTYAAAVISLYFHIHPSPSLELMTLTTVTLQLHLQQLISNYLTTIQKRGCDSRFRGSPARWLKISLQEAFPRYFRGFPTSWSKGQCRIPVPEITSYW